MDINDCAQKGKEERRIRRRRSKRLNMTNDVTSGSYNKIIKTITKPDTVVRYTIVAT